MAQGPESKIQGKIVEMIESFPTSHVRKVHGGKWGSGGEPDLDACVNGRSVKLEIKAPGNEPTTLQMKKLRVWEAAGALAGWADSVQQARELLTHLEDYEWKNPQLAKSPSEQPKP